LGARLTASQPGAWTRISRRICHDGREPRLLSGNGSRSRPPSTIYLCICAYDVSKGGLYKTTDGGGSWRKIGQLDEPIHIVIDPKDSKHLCCIDGVRGNTQGFWVSATAERDGLSRQVSLMQREANRHARSLLNRCRPSDFNHMLVSFHSPWDWQAGTCGYWRRKTGKLLDCS